MELYTSLTRAKRVLMGTRNINARSLPAPAMTPVPEEVAVLIDPSFTIGYGAMRECGEVDGFPCPECEGACQHRGLQCPVRGCGMWYQQLGRHLNEKHARVGGARKVLAMLGIPSSVALASSELRHKHRQSLDVGSRLGKGNFGRIKETKDLRPDVADAARAGVKKTRSTVGWRNLQNSCDAQIGQRMHALVDRLGRGPTCKEADSLDPGLTHAAVKLYGSWSNAKFQLGLERRVNPPTISKQEVLSGLKEWYLAWGELPSSRDTYSPERTPIIPARATVLKALGVTQWEAAMQIAASELALPYDAYRHRTKADGSRPWRKAAADAQAESAGVALSPAEVRAELLASLKRRQNPNVFT